MFESGLFSRKREQFAQNVAVNGNLGREYFGQKIQTFSEISL